MTQSRISQCVYHILGHAGVLRGELIGPARRAVLEHDLHVLAVVLPEALEPELVRVRAVAAVAVGRGGAGCELWGAVALCVGGATSETRPDAHPPKLLYLIRAFDQSNTMCSAVHVLQLAGYVSPAGRTCRGMRS